MKLRYLPIIVLLFAASSFSQIIGGNVTVSGPVTPGDCAKFLSTHVIQDAGAACGAGSGLTASGPPTAGQVPLWTSGTNLSGTTLPLGDLLVGTSSSPIVQVKSGIDVRDTSVAPISTNDFCAALNAAMITAVSAHNYVEAGNPGGFLTGAKVFCATNPFLGVPNPPYIHFGNYTIVISVPWITGSNPFQVWGDVPSVSSGTIIQACNASSGSCGPSSYPIFPGTGANSRMFPLAGPFSPYAYATGTITTAYAVTSVATGTGVYQGTFTGCAAGACNGYVVNISGFVTHASANNGLTTITASTATQITTTNIGSISESASAFASSGTITGSGTTWTPQMVDGEICISSPCTKSSNFAVISAVTDATHIVLFEPTLGTTTGGGQAYTIILPNATALVEDGVLETTVSDGIQASCFGHQWYDVTFDTNSVGSAVGYWTPNCQERSVLLSPKFIGQGNQSSQNTTPLNLTLTSVNTAGVYQGTITGGGSNAFVGFIFHVTGFTNAQNNGDFIATASSTSALTLNATTINETHAGTAAGGTAYACAAYDRSFQYGGNSGATHYTITGNPQCGPGDMSTTSTSYGYIFEEQRQVVAAPNTVTGLSNDGSDANNGPMDLGTVAGKLSNLLTACVWVDGSFSMELNQMHTEWCTTGVEVGLNNPATIKILGIHGANTNTKLVWLHSNAFGSTIEMASAGGAASPTLIQDDATGGITITGSSCTSAFGQACLVPLYIQAASSTAYVPALTASGTIASTSDGVHNGEISLFGNTTNPSLTTGSFSFLGPITTVSTPWAIQWPAAENGSAGILHVGAASSHISAATVSAIVSGDITSLAESKLTGSAAATTITEVGTGDAITRASVETGNLTSGQVFTNLNSTNNNTSIGLIDGATGTSTGGFGELTFCISCTGDIHRWYMGGSVAAGVYTVGTLEANLTAAGAFNTAGGTVPTVGTSGGWFAIEGTAPTGTSTNYGMYNDSTNHCPTLLRQSTNVGCATGNNGANTAGTAMTLDMSAATGATALKVPVIAGATAGADGVIDYDSTAKSTKIRAAGLDAVATAAICRTIQKSETTTPDANVLTCTPASVAGPYRINISISVSAATSGVIGWTATWTDSNGNAQTPTNLDLFQDTSAGGNGTAAPALTFTTSAASNYHGSVVVDVNNAGTNIVIKWTGGGTTTAKMTAIIEKIT